MSVKAFGGPFTRGGAPVLYICVLKVHPAQDGFSRNVCSGNKHLLVYEKCHICKLSAPQSASLTLLGESFGFIKSCQMHISNVNYTQAGIIMQKS